MIAEGFTQLLKRQADEVQATLMQTLSTENQVLHPTPLQDADIGAAIDDAADWSTQVDGNNAMLARYERLADKKQPQWLKNLTSSQIRGYQYLDRVEQKSVERLAPMLEKIPTLHQFANQQLNLALQKKIPWGEHRRPEDNSRDYEEVARSYTFQARSVHPGQLPNQSDIAHRPVTEKPDGISRRRQQRARSGHSAIQAS